MFRAESDPAGMAPGTVTLLVVAEDSEFARSSPTSLELTLVGTNDAMSCMAAPPTVSAVAASTAAVLKVINSYGCDLCGAVCNRKAIVSEKAEAVPA